MNAFTDATRTQRIALDIAGFVGKLRAPEVLHRLISVAKPAHVTNADFALKAMLDEYLMALIVRGDYAGLQVTLGRVFGPSVPDGTEEGTVEARVTSGTRRAREA